MNQRANWMKSKGLIRNVVMMLLSFGMLQPALRAQTVSFANAQITVGSGLVVPRGVAVDAAGNVYIADSRNRRAVKVSASGIQTILDNVMYEPNGVAVDKAGNVLVADTAAGTLVEIYPNNARATLLSGLNFPEGVATDSKGNIYVADASNGRVLKLVPGSAPTTVGNNLNTPYGLAVDRGDNLFIVDPVLQQLIEVSSTGVQTTVASGFNLRYAFGLAVDGSGNLYFSDYLWGSVIKRSPDGAETTVAAGLKSPYGVAIDGNGNLFIAESGNNRILEVEFKAATVGAANVCPIGQSSPAPCSKTITLNYNIATSGTLGLPIVLTQGRPNLDFTLAPGSTCTGAVIAGTSCTVNVAFAPLALGLRMGIVQLTDASGNILATTPVSGHGEGPVIGFGTGTQSAIGSGLDIPFTLPSNVAEDGMGNIFVADTGNNRMVKLAPDGTQSAMGAGLLQPLGSAVDGAGNVYIADYGNNRVVKVSPAGDQTTVGGNVNAPYGVAVDGWGNLFIVETGFNRVLKVAPDGTKSVIASESQFTAVAVDAAGNAFIVDYSNSSVNRISPNGDKTTTAAGLYSPRGVAVDAAGNVYIVTANSIVEVSPDGSQTPVLQGLFFPGGVTVDGAGNIILADTQNNRILNLHRSQPAGLSFAPTFVGSTSSDSPKLVTIQNIGTQPLNAVAPGLTIDSNFQQATGSGTPADCTATFSLAPGASCKLSISFVPQTEGSIQSTAVLTDSSMNAGSATQIIPLSGTGMPVTPTTTTVTAVSGQYSDAVTLTAVIGSSTTSFTGSLQFKVDGANACSAPVTGSGTYTCGYTIAQKSGSSGLTAALTSTTPSVKGSTGSATLTVTKEDASIVPSTANPSTVQVNSAGGTAGPVTLKGTLQQAADGSLGDISKAVVTVTLVPAVAGAANISCPVTNTNGALSATCSNVPVDDYTVQWSLAGDYYQGPQVNGLVAVYDPSLGSVKGSGSVRDNGVAADFTINVKYQKNGTLNGSISYVEHRTTGDVKVSSTALSSMSLVGATAIIDGQATVNGVAGYTLHLVVTDNGTQAANRDTFALQLSGGALTPPISFTPVTITSGDIQVH